MYPWKDATEPVKPLRGLVGDCVQNGFGTVKQLSGSESDSFIVAVIEINYAL